MVLKFGLNREFERRSFSSQLRFRDLCDLLCDLWTQRDVTEWSIAVYVEAMHRLSPPEISLEPSPATLRAISGGVASMKFPRIERRMFLVVTRLGPSCRPISPCESSRIDLLAFSTFSSSAANEPEGPRELAIQLGAPFHDHAVLQRGMSVPVWGWSKPGTKVTVEFSGQKKSASAGKDGKWTIELNDLKASFQPAQLVISEEGGKKETPSSSNGLSLRSWKIKSMPG